MQNQIVQTLRSIGITGNYRGYRQLCVAVALAAEDEERLVRITRDIYIPTSEILHCNRKTIERNIRTVIRRIWETDPSGYIAISGALSSEPPTVAEFIDTLAYHVRCTCAARIN